MGSELKILIDSCVWVDSYLGDHPRHDESVAFIQEAYESGAQLLFGASKLETVFSVLTAEVKRMIRREKGIVEESDAAAVRAFAWGCVENIRSYATAIGMDDSDLWLASKYRSINSDLEDNVLLAAAQRADVDYVVTWDKDVLRIPVIKGANPAQMRELLKL